MRSTTGITDGSGTDISSDTIAAHLGEGGRALPRERANRPLSSLGKRALDLLFATVLTIGLAPLWLLIALLIRLDSPGPVLYRQTRVGRGGIHFGLLKFRTMHIGAHDLREELRHLSCAGDLFKIHDDPRVTRIGRVLRATSLDEAPQLLHVLTGKMSLVGPRPLVPDEDANVAERHRDRLSVRPGLTGPWQVAGRERHSLKHMAELDSEYVREWTIASDIRLIARTVVHVVLARGM